jgi:branched-chain amino acid transport system permease protein
VGLGAGLAALGGILQGLSEQVSFQIGFQLLLLMFRRRDAGGLGTAYGALVGSLVVGMAMELSTLWIPTEFKTVVALMHPDHRAPGAAPGHPRPGRAVG